MDWYLADWWVNPLFVKMSSVASNQIGWPLNHGPGKMAEVIEVKTSLAQQCWCSKSPTVG